MIRLTKLLNEVKENRIYLAGLGVLLEKVNAFLPDAKKAVILSKMTGIQELAEKINNTPYGLFTSGEVHANITCLSTHITELQSALSDLLPEYGDCPQQESAIKCALKAINEIYDY